MKFTCRLLVVLAVVILGLISYATPSTSEGTGTPWAPDCFQCPGSMYGDPDGGTGGTATLARSFRYVVHWNTYGIVVFWLNSSASPRHPMVSRLTPLSNHHRTSR